MDLTFKDDLIPRRRYEELIDDLKRFFSRGTEDNSVKINRVKSVKAVKAEKTTREIDQAEVERLNAAMMHCYIEKNEFSITNADLSQFMIQLCNYSGIGNAINLFDSDEKNIFTEYFNELEECINEIKNERQKHSVDNDVFQNIIDKFKIMLKNVLVGRFIDRINENYNHSENYKHLICAVNSYMSNLGVYTLLLKNNYRDRSQSEFSPTATPEYTDDKSKHNLIKEVLRLPYCFEYSETGAKVKQVVPVKGKVVCYSNKIDPK